MLNRLVQEFNERNKQTLIRQDADGIYRLQGEKGALFSLEQDPYGEDFFLYTILATLSKGGAKEIALKALSYNLFGIKTKDATLGFEEKEGFLVQHLHIPSTTDVIVFEEIIATFIGTAEMLKEEFNAFDDFGMDRHLTKLKAHEDLKIFFA